MTTPRDARLILCVISDVKIVVTRDGSPPTPDTAIPLDEDGARASMVWFTQATVLQSSVMKYSTVKKTKEMEREAQRLHPRKEPYFVTTFDTARALANNYFPLSPTS